MALDKVKQGVIADDAVGSSQIAPDTVVAADIGANAITASELADNAVDTAAIASNAVTTAKITDANITTAKVANSAITSLKLGDVIDTVPHIIPGTLYPAIGGKGIDGTTTVSSFGTDVTINGDTRQYYYTDIKGSKPIKDPRIGGHFGSQRHKFKSLQLLEQETATHGNNVYSVDGRDWIRACGDKWVVMNNSNGCFLENSTATLADDNHFFEIVGYFSDANLLHWPSGTANDLFGVTLNGGTREPNNLNAGVASPLSSRYVDSASVVNCDFHSGSTPVLGINTLRISNTNGAYLSTFGIELIAQDLSGSGSPSRSKIQIPAQNVVSFGKKFSVSAEGSSGHHYDPFSAKTDGSAWTSPTSGNNTANSAASWPTNIDTAHSLGLENWVNGSSYYRPYNGGRVVKYVDSTGTIKTAVTVMPPNARSIGNANNLSGGAEKGDDSAGNTSAAAPNDNFRPTFTDQTIATAQDLHEIAKAFHFREFGNGSANGGTGAAYADATMLTSTKDNIAYIMDDGTTALVGSDIKTHGSHPNTLLVDDTNDYHHITFIGTGIGFKTTTDVAYGTSSILGQNLPYGTHILKSTRSANGTTFTLDGVVVATDSTTILWTNFREVDFYQPKKPPIPEDACVIADYMLMADYVELSSITGTDFTNKISKGVRRISGTRDVFVTASSSTGMGNVAQGDIATMGPWGMYSFYSPSGSVDATVKLPFFGSKFFTWAEGTTGYGSSSNYAQSINSTSLTITAQDQANGTSSPQHLDALTNNSSEALGNNIINHTQARGQFRFVGFDLQSPIHTSSHYQSFEAPFLHELVGGDRNMEQTNLVCSPDGKTWDEVTRNTSYIGGGGVRCDIDSSSNTHGFLVFTEWRGEVDKFYDGSSTQSYTTSEPFYTKNFAIAYDRLICLKDGKYHIYFQTHTDTLMNTSNWGSIQKNGKALMVAYFHDANYPQVPMSCVTHLVRGDYVQIKGVAKGDLQGQAVLNITQV